MAEKPKKPEAPTVPAGPSPRPAGKVEKWVTEQIREAEQRRDELVKAGMKPAERPPVQDPKASKPEPYNPLNKKNLGESVVDALMTQPIQPLPPEKSFTGAGVYAIYYIGDHEAYELLAARNRGEKWAVPIYVGKAVPKGGRKGKYGLDANPGPELYHRLVEHADTIKATELRVEDFRCRYLVVDDIWIPLGETLLIERLSPPWNHTLDGFGIHDPGKGRYQGKRSAWDVMHPGRKWVERSAPHGKTKEELLKAVRDFLAERYPAE